MLVDRVLKVFDLKMSSSTWSRNWHRIWKEAAIEDTGSQWPYLEDVKPKPVFSPFIVIPNSEPLSGQNSQSSDDMRLRSSIITRSKSLSTSYQPKLKSSQSKRTKAVSKNATSKNGNNGTADKKISKKRNGRRNGTVGKKKSKSLQPLKVKSIHEISNDNESILSFGLPKMNPLGSPKIVNKKNSQNIIGAVADKAETAVVPEPHSAQIQKPASGQSCNYDLRSGTREQHSGFGDTDTPTTSKATPGASKKPSPRKARPKAKSPLRLRQKRLEQEIVIPLLVTQDSFIEKEGSPPSIPDNTSVCVVHVPSASSASWEMKEEPADDILEAELVDERSSWDNYYSHEPDFVERGITVVQMSSISDPWAMEIESSTQEGAEISKSKPMIRSENDEETVGERKRGVAVVVVPVPVDSVSTNAQHDNETMDIEVTTSRTDIDITKARNEDSPTYNMDTTEFTQTSQQQNDTDDVEILEITARVVKGRLDSQQGMKLYRHRFVTYFECPKCSQQFENKQATLIHFDRCI